MKNMFLLAVLGGFAMLFTGCSSTGAFSYGYHDWSVNNQTGTYCASGWYDKQNCTQTYSPKKGVHQSVSQTRTIGGYNVNAMQTPAYENYSQTPLYTYTYPQTQTYSTQIPPANYSNYNLGLNWGNAGSTQPIGGYGYTRPYR